jgi:ribosomal protein S21
VTGGEHEPVDAAVKRLRDRQASARVLEREASLREWLADEFVKTPDDKQEEEERE